MRECNTLAWIVALFHESDSSLHDPLPLACEPHVPVLPSLMVWPLQLMGRSALLSSQTSKLKVQVADPHVMVPVTWTSRCGQVESTGFAMNLLVTVAVHPAPETFEQVWPLVCKAVPL